MGTSLVTIWGFIWLEKCHKLGIQGGAAGFSPGKDDYLGKIQSQSVSFALTDPVNANSEVTSGLIKLNHKFILSPIGCS